MSDKKQIAFDKNGVELPQGYLFGKIPYYSNRYKNAKGFDALIPYISVVPLAVYLSWDSIKIAFF